MLIASFTSCANKDKSENTTPELKQIKSICTLATLECHYNNVAKGKKEVDNGISHLFEKEREFWIEYTGTAKIGIEMENVTMKITDTNIKITMPKAKLLSTNYDEDTYKIVSSKDGINKKTAEDQENAINEAQENMKTAVENNSSLMGAAQRRAETLIENYINQLGSFSGVEYTITWEYIE
ncbi:MAG: DUF4230 domain-containing protein [Clostridia bacterium]|nr:DUF4230 domain-containing protein [Clostridia bacterium]